MMDEHEFQRKCEEAFESLQKRLQDLGDEHDFEVEGGSGKLEIEFEDDDETRFVISQFSGAPNLDFRADHQLQVGLVGAAASLRARKDRRNIESSNESHPDPAARRSGERMRAKPTIRITAAAVAVAFAGALAFFPALPVLSQNGGANPSVTPNGATVVTPIAYVSLDQVPRGKTVDIALVLNIAKGYHINSHTPSQSYLIPTNVTLADTSGFQATGSNYPEGQTLKFAFSEDKLSVYSGSATIWLRFQAQNDAPLGEITCRWSCASEPQRDRVLAAGEASGASARLHSDSRHQDASQRTRKFSRTNQKFSP